MYAVSKILHQQTVENIQYMHRLDIEGSNPE
jgi:Glu-tRNA(Gln) amidotransferase subunit E-like FAD-binding protein